MHEREVKKAYLRELFGALALYCAVLTAALHFGSGMAAGPARTAVLLSPSLPFLLMVWAVVRQVRRMDEYLRLIALEDFAIIGAVTAGWTFTYGFLETAGFPRLSMFTIWPAMGATWLALCALRWLRRR
ncbi:MAG TPA: hypothetical protein VGI57_15790 [Usitatibacter sp.]|jgi:hypothetical protein